MQPADFQFLAQLLKQRSGLSITSDKEYLLETRLQPIVRQRKCQTLEEFISLVRRSSTDENLMREVTEAMTTNESMFFRDTKPFDQLRETLLPRMKDKKTSGKLRIWSAACSNGQEPYSIAMTLLEQRTLLGALTPEILATDLDTQVLNKAKEGLYTQFEVQRGMPITLLLKYFTQIESNQWKIKDVIKNAVLFKQHNLLHSYQVLGKFDAIFCRNVLIYFDEETKKTVLARLADALEPHGYLFLGAAETVLSLCDKLRPVPDLRGVYELKP
ncbi:MAG: protein-glutamate O-methyltransferase CheR [Rickettsiales bacterium]|nr:protein-glutamate O-methyltransferase CheR [Rickettsiales bacterium]